MNRELSIFKMSSSCGIGYPNHIYEQLIFTKDSEEEIILIAHIYI